MPLKGAIVDHLLIEYHGSMPKRSYIRNVWRIPERLHLMKFPLQQIKHIFIHYKTYTEYSVGHNYNTIKHKRVFSILTQTIQGHIHDIRILYIEWQSLCSIIDDILVYEYPQETRAEILELMLIMVMKMVLTLWSADMIIHHPHNVGVL